MNEYEVIIKGQNQDTILAYVYADSEYEAKQQAVRQGFAMHRIKEVRFHGKRGKVGHI